jgi:hypothetical protein
MAQRNSNSDAFAKGTTPIAPPLLIQEMDRVFTCGRHCWEYDAHNRENGAHWCHRR